MGFSNGLGYLSLTSILCLLIIYFLRPKPFKRIMPSLIFFEAQKKKKRLFTLLGRFIKDWLFLVQLLVLVLLCIAAFLPFAMIPMRVQENEVIFVIDASASDFDSVFVRMTTSLRGIFFSALAICWWVP